MIRQLNPNEVVDEIFDLYSQHGGSDYIGEPVSQLEHMAQTAELAEQEGYDDEVILAAFFHDIGHLCSNNDQPDMKGYGAMNHEKQGAVFLKERGFSDRLVFLVQAHVAAKRYLTFKFPEYSLQLSEASRITLSFQGGIMTKTEAEEFEKHPDFKLMLKFRTWDDCAKIKDLPVNSLQKLKEKTLNYLLSRTLVVI
ncbi:MAG: HDIG domain-containing protein [Flavobacterium sp.]|nr:HDIG domain-containing protein [Pedobacter sp.]